ncbi:MAG: hypothetical protein V2B19_16925 [Pseudomonadota bacterium]
MTSTMFGQRSAHKVWITATPFYGLSSGHDLDGTNHEHFVRYAASLPLSCAAYKCLVHFDRELLTDGVPFRTDHCGPEFMKHLKSSLVPFNSEHFF